LDLYKTERTRLPLEDVIENMKNRDIKIDILGTHSGTSLDLLDPPSLPSKPTSPSRLKIALFGLAAGGATGNLAFGLRRWLQRKT
jgi:uncharacterized protein involved in exopolysaccharide biosynthesis